MSAWWRELLEIYELGAHHLELLRLACEAWDVAQDARSEIAANGPTVLDRFNQVKPNPAATVWKENVNSFRLLVRELGLDKLPDAPRAPRLY
jgi:P27 family predicted phage terminase small subunit